MDLVHDHDRDDGHVSRIIKNDGKRAAEKKRIKDGTHLSVSPFEGCEEKRSGTREWY